MKKYNALYYLLFILLITGAFASMAQNNYGLKIMGGVAFLFSLIFLYELTHRLKSKGEKDAWAISEITSLLVFSLIFGFRVFYIRFPYMNYVFAFASLMLIIFYSRQMLQRYKAFQPLNKALAILVILFHLCIIFFLVSLTVISFSAEISRLAAFIAFGLLVLFLLLALIKGKTLVDGKYIGPWSMISNFTDHSVIIFSLCLLLSLFVTLNRARLLPRIYSDEYPQAYFQLVNDANAGRDKKENGQYKYEEFKKRYEEFIRHRK